MHSSSEQVLRPRVSGDEPAESYAVESGARLPPLQPGLYSVRISVHDAFPGTAFERAPRIHLHAHVGGALTLMGDARDRCRARLGGVAADHNGGECGRWRGRRVGRRYIGRGRNLGGPRIWPGC